MGKGLWFFFMEFVGTKDWNKVEKQLKDYEERRCAICDRRTGDGMVCSVCEVEQENLNWSAFDG